MANLRSTPSSDKPERSDLKARKTRAGRTGRAGARKTQRGSNAPRQAAALEMDLAAVPRARPASMPHRLEPQLATRSSLAPSGDEWLHEIKFDGYRLLARIDGEEVRLYSRNGKDWTARFPDLAATLSALDLGQAVLDGELVAMQADGTSSFRQLQEALASKRTSNLIYEVFDLLHIGGYDLSNSPLEARKKVLRDLLASRDILSHRGPIRYVHHFEGKGEELFGEVCQLGLEGIMSKLRTGRYQSGRTSEWLKVKCVQQGEFVVGGYTDPSNARIGFGALLLGAYNERHQLCFTGSVGSGFSAQRLRSLYQQLRELEIEWCPFNSDQRLNIRGAHWVRPELVADVEYSEWTRDGSLRHPVFRGLREDRNPSEIVLSHDAPLPEEPRVATGHKAGRTPGPSRPVIDDRVAGVRLTHPDRILYPEQGVTKLHLARYYEQVQDQILPHLARRPLSLVRCPEGQSGPCFYQKHPMEGLSSAVGRVEIEEGGGPATYLYVETVQGIVSLVQMGVLEFHCWGSRIDALETPDQLVFDLDPGPGVTWPRLIEGARTLQARLESLELTAFPKLTGSKGLHLVVPIVADIDWDRAKEFTRLVAEGLAREHPERFTANMAKQRRHGRIFLDYLRNGRGSTAVAAYSTRARPGAPVAVPIAWEELDPGSRSDRYGIDTVKRRLAALRREPWADFEAARVPVTERMFDAAGTRAGAER